MTRRKNLIYLINLLNSKKFGKQMVLFVPSIRFLARLWKKSLVFKINMSVRLCVCNRKLSGQNDKCTKRNFWRGF